MKTTDIELRLIHNAVPSFLTPLEESVLAGLVSGWIRGFVVVSLKTSLKYRRTATPSPHECSKLTAVRPVLVMINEKLLSNQLQDEQNEASKNKNKLSKPIKLSFHNYLIQSMIKTVVSNWTKEFGCAKQNIEKNSGKWITSMKIIK